MAFIIALAVMLFLCVANVQASPVMSSSLDASTQETKTLPAAHRYIDKQIKLDKWHGDYSDISNERVGKSLEATNPKTLKGAVLTEVRPSFLGKLGGLFKGLFNGASSDSSPSFVSP